jgi:hypothetical protein
MARLSEAELDIGGPTSPTIVAAGGVASPVSAASDASCPAMRIAIGAATLLGQQPEIMPQFGEMCAQELIIAARQR